MKTEFIPAREFNRRRFLQCLGGGLALLGVARGGLPKEKGPRSFVVGAPAPDAPGASNPEPGVGDGDGMADPGWSY